MINNKTELNSSLYTYLSSGAIDIIMAKDWSINNWPPSIDPDKEGIPIGDRYTVFLGELFTDTHLINLEMLGQHKTVIIKFQTTKDYSFNLHHSGNRNLPYDIQWGKGTEKWNKGKVNNLEKYFNDFKVDKLYFTILIHKGNGYEYYVELYVSESDKKSHRILYLPTSQGHTTSAGLIMEDEINFIKDIKDTLIVPRLSKLKEWNTKSDGSGTRWLPNDSIILNEDLVLYAIWGEQQYVPNWIPITYLPLGYNLKGKNIKIDNLHLPINPNWLGNGQDIRMNQRIGSHGGYARTPVITAEVDVISVIIDEIEYATGGIVIYGLDKFGDVEISIYRYDWDSMPEPHVRQWLKTQFTMPNDKDYIIDEFEEESQNGYWDFNSMMVEDSNIVKIPLTEIPSGYNLRGKKIVFERTDLLIDSKYQTIENDLWFNDSNGFGGYLTSGAYGLDMIAVLGMDDLFDEIIYHNGIWEKSTLQFPSDTDLIVDINNLMPHEGDYWGFDYAYVIDTGLKIKTLSDFKIGDLLNKNKLIFKLSYYDHLKPYVGGEYGESMLTWNTLGPGAQIYQVDDWYGTGENIIQFQKEGDPILNIYDSSKNGWLIDELYLPVNDSKLSSLDDNLPFNSRGSWNWSNVIVKPYNPIKLTDIPIGFDMSARKLLFTNTIRLMSYFGYNELYMGNESRTFQIVKMLSGGIEIHQYQYNTPVLNMGDISQPEVGRWVLNGEETFPDVDILVHLRYISDGRITENNLPIHIGDGWGFDYAYVVE